MTEHLSPLDATFLELEEADESAHMHIGGILVFEPAPERGAPTLSELREQLEERLPTLPRYRQRLSAGHTGGLHWPAWEPDPDFDIAAHVRHAALPAPGDDRELLEWAGDYWSHRLDRKRPLWDVVLLEGLSNGRWALCTKTHHCMVDGVGSIDASHLLLDPSPEGTPPASPPAQEDASDENGGAGFWPLDLVRGGVRAGVGLASAGVGAALHPRRLAEALERSVALAELIVRDEMVAAPATSLNNPIGTRRRFDDVEVPLEEMKRIKNALGGTVNDVVLAATSGGLRRLLLSRGEELPSRGLRAMVPVNLRAAGDELALGNRITSLFAHLPVAEPEPLVRYRLAAGEAEALKSGSQALGGATLVDLAGHAPPVLHAFVARSLFATRLFNVAVTNVPGPQMPLYAFGSRLVSIAPLVPLAAEHAVGVAVLSYDGKVTFGLNADFDAVPDLDVLRDGIEESLAELREVAMRAPSPAASSPD